VAAQTRKPPRKDFVAVVALLREEWIFTTAM
jgi:hypothetical protein